VHNGVVAGDARREVLTQDIGRCSKASIEAVSALDERHAPWTLVTTTGLMLDLGKIAGVEPDDDCRRLT
jgi:hypothetical protein